MGAEKRVALYVRVSTDGQTTVNQQRELEAVAERHGWAVVDLFKDHAISGNNGREKRPAFDRMLEGVVRKDFDLIAAWSVDRLGRSLQHLLAFTRLVAERTPMLAFNGWEILQRKKYEAGAPTNESP